MFGHVCLISWCKTISIYDSVIFLYERKRRLKKKQFYHKLLKIHMQSIFPARGFSIVLVYTTLVMFWTLRKCSDKM